jgi:hypothetical protein
MADKDKGGKISAQKHAEKIIKNAGGKQTKDGKWDMQAAVDRLKGK